jgi:hypothetical protein
MQLKNRTMFESNYYRIERKQLLPLLTGYQKFESNYYRIERMVAPPMGGNPHTFEAKSYTKPKI